MIETSGYINMKKKYLSLLVLPLILTSCNGGGVSLAAMRDKVNNISDAALYPYYKVVGSADFNNMTYEIDAEFANEPGASTFVPYSRYNDGFYNATLDTSEADLDDIVIYSMASKSYWLRAPLRINKSNFYVEVEDEGSKRENTTCAHYILQHIITSYIGQTGSTNPSKNQMKMAFTSSGGFVFYGEAVHTTLYIDNLPYYPDPAEHPEIGEWDPEYPIPCYKNKLNAKVNVRFEYNAEGWLIKESLSTLDYDYSHSTASQASLVAVYGYKFN